jgi:hypothetical protein
MPSTRKGSPNSRNEQDYSDWVVEDRRKHDADWVDEKCDEDYADYADCVVEDRLEDYAPCNPEEERLARKDIEASIALMGKNISHGEIEMLADPIRRLRWSDLNYKEVVCLWNAISFHMFQYGEVMSVHIVILWQTLGVTDHGKARYLLGQYLNRCQKWGQVGLKAPLNRRRQLQRSLRQSRHGKGFVFRYVFTNECSGNKGFHSHVLASVPLWLVPVFEAWSLQTLGKLAQHPGTEKTLRVVVPSKAITESDAVERQWCWFRYICKQLELEDEPRWGNLAEPPQRLRDVLKLWPYQSGLPVRLPEGQLTGTSRDIGAAAQKAAGFLSELTSGDLTRIYDGHEFEDYRARLQEEERQKLLSTLHT